MIQGLPIHISLAFVIITFLSLWFLFSAGRSKVVLFVSIVWLIVQAVVSYSGFYTFTNSIPPRFVLLIAPPLVVIMLLFISKKGRAFIDSLNINKLTLLHIVRIPVEFTLLLLFIHKQVPQLMTFEGRNFDVLSGITAPFILYFGSIKKMISPKIILIWNFICLGLLLNIVINAVLSAPFPFQKFGFDQPDVALLYFPFVWLPCFVVPVVLFAHLVSIRQLLRK